MSRQCAIIKDSIVDIDNRFSEVFLFFSLFNYEFSLENRLIDIFSNHFSSHSLNRKSDYNVKSYLLKLNSITLQASSDPHLVIVVIDASIKNQVATSISHVHIHNRLVIKTTHHAVNIMSTEAKLFAINMVLIKLPIFLMSNVSLLLWIPSTLPKEYLIHHPIHIKFIQQQYLVNSESFSKNIVTIPLSFGIVLVIANGYFTT